MVQVSRRTNRTQNKEVLHCAEETPDTQGVGREQASRYVQASPVMVPNVRQWLTLTPVLQVKVIPSYATFMQY